MERKYINVSLFIMIFSSSIMAVEFNGISLNKMGMIPFVLIALLSLIRQHNTVISINRRYVCYTSFLLISCLSAFFGILHPVLDRERFLSTELNYIIQVVLMYIPIILFVSKYDKEYSISDKFFKYLIYIARFHAIWILAQFVIFYASGVNITSVIYDDWLGGITGLNWNSFVYGSSVVLRAAGLNQDPAFASYIMTVGFIFDRNSKFRWMYIVAPILAQSRTGFLAILVIAIYDIVDIKKIINGIKLNYKRILPPVLILVILVILLKTNHTVQTQFNSIIYRIQDIFSVSNQDISTTRHSSYPIIAIQCWAGFKNYLYILLGVGPRASGLALLNFVQRNRVNFEFTKGMLNNVWAVECDFAEILLGYGIIGLILYYLNLVKIFLIKNKRIKEFAVAMILIGFMYDFSSISFNVLFIIFVLALSLKDENYGKYSNCTD